MNTTTTVPLKVDLSKVDWTANRANSVNLVSLHAVNDGFLIYYSGWLAPTSLFSINTNSGETKSLIIENIPTFSGRNPNRMMTTQPLTLPTLESVLITAAALLLGLILIWGQDAREHRKKRQWFDSTGFPGSKLATDTNEVDFEAHQRAHQEEVARHFQSVEQRDTQQQQDQLEYRPTDSRFNSSPLTRSLPQMLTVGEHSAGGSRTSLLTATALGEVEIMNGSNRSGPLLPSRSVGSPQFSNHPRPNVVTIIAGVPVE